MQVVSRGALQAPVLPKETVDVEALGGAVVVRGLRLTERLTVQSDLVRLRAAHAAGDASADVHVVVPMILSIAVLDADNEPIWTDAQWEIFGAQHSDQAMALFNVAWRLSGFREAEEAKN